MEDTKNKNPTKWNLLDRFIEAVSPKAAYERLRWRSGIGGYDAGNHNRGNAGWLPMNSQGELINRQARRLMRARAQDMERNSDIMGSILDAYRRNIVGRGFNLQARTDNADFNVAAETLWREWCKPRNCDITGQQSFREILNMVVDRAVIDGEVLIIKTYTGDAKFPFQLQIRESADLDSLGKLSNDSNGNLICDGIEVNQYNKPVAYYFTETDANGMTRNTATRVEASRVIYLWHRKRPTEYRGVTKIAGIIDRIHNLDDYFKAVSFMQKILASLCVFIKQTLPDGALGGLGRTNQKIIEDNDPNSRQQKIKAGQIMYLKPGEEATSINPSGNSAEAEGFGRQQQRMASAAMGLSLEATARDMSKMNYSSARQNLLEDNKTYIDWQLWLQEHALDEIYTEFLISAYLAGQFPMIPDFWKNKENYFQHRFIAQGMSWIDPLKEANANKTMLDSGQATLEEICAKKGQDWKEVLNQRAKEQAYMKELGLVMNEGGTTDAQPGNNDEDEKNDDSEE